ncbi:MAG: tetratricopeptide repeat protein [Candidatus Brocadiales bacterium]|nr:tetratricopeptide repeat protein [Candidatus Brocadiales bacterium]
MRLILFPRYIPLLLLLIIFIVGGCGVQDPDYYNRMGVFLDSQGKIDEAVKKYKKSLRIDPTNREAHYNLAVAYHKKGLFNEAIQEYKTVLELYPNDPETLYNLGAIYARSNMQDAAVFAWQRPLN